MLVPAVLFCSLVFTRIFLPLPLLVLVFWTIFAASMILWTGQIGLGLLPRFYLACYGMSFLVFFDYLFSDYSTFAQGLPMADALAGEQGHLAFVLSCGIIGLIGLVSGFELTRLLSPPARVPTVNTIRERDALGIGYLAFCYWLPLVFTLVLFVSMPRATILTMSYGEITSGMSRPLVDGLAFDGLGYIVYIWFAAVWIVSEQPTLSPEARYKVRRFLVVLLGFVVVFLNLLKGSRTVAGLIAAVAFLYISERPRPEDGVLDLRALMRKRVRRILPWGLAIFAVFMVWGEVRATYVEGAINWAGMWERLSKVYRSGEWVAGIFACLGLAEEFFAGSMQFLYGRTYLDYLMSLPPGPIANLLDFERPINATQGPSWWYQGYTVGGMNPIVVPFKNFGPIGVLIHMAICGLCIGWAEVLAARHHVLGRLFFAGFIIGGFHWFWYGDMYIVRVVMITSIVAFFYRLMVGRITRS
jgi:oligosaccharide repeat unit polymerase